MTGRLSMRMVGRLGLVGVIGLAALVPGCTGSGAGSAGGATSANAVVQPLASIEMLRGAFNADTGATRLILLVSPT
jgi:hypothetical protein